jgi:hypothetical protein
MARPSSSPVVNTGRRHALTLLSGLLLVLAAAVLVVVACLPASGPISRALAGSSAASPVRAVASTSRQLYCPPAIGLSDSGSYGDSSFAASAGDLASARTLLTFGSVYDGQVAGLSASATADTLSLPSGKKAGVTRSQASSSIVSTQQLSASAGDGLAGVSASWASTGDVQGIAATSCAASVSRAGFLLPSTQVGRSARLLVANDSDKSTVIALRLWGASSAGQIHPAANSQISVAAHSSQTINLSALTGHQNAAFVEARSTAVAVHMLVETTAASGLTSKGVDFAPTITAVRSGTLTGLSKGSSARLLLFSSSDARVEGHWLSSDGQEDAEHLASGVRVNAGRVTSVDLGSVPESVGALHLDADRPVYAQIVQTTAGSDGQEDYSLIAPTVGQKVSALAVPKGLDADVLLANSGSSTLTVRLRTVSAQGSVGGGRTVSLQPQSSVTLALSDIAGNAGTGSVAGITATLTSGSAADLSAAASLSSSTLSSASVAQGTVVPFSSLMPASSRVSAVRSPLAAVGSAQ